MKSLSFIPDIIKSDQFFDIEVFVALNRATRKLAELKGKEKIIPNPEILINTIALQESQDSCEIENIITTRKAMYEYYLNRSSNSLAEKEVDHYRETLAYMHKEYKQNQLITTNMLVDAQAIIKENNAGIRKLPGTQIINERTKEVVYTPPAPDELQDLLTDLEKFINGLYDDCELDPIIKMAIIHHQFESIHPFYDGNGRIGRILNIVYLIKENLLDEPVLYLSRYINHNRSEYYRLLKYVNDTGQWKQWLLYMIVAVEKTAESTIKLIDKILDLKQTYEGKVRALNVTKSYKGVVESIFMHVYTKSEFLHQDLQVSRPTAYRYLEELVKAKLLEKRKIGKINYYFNVDLFNLLEKPENLKNKQY